MSKRVAIIGAGPCSLGQLHCFEEARNQGADVPEIVCYEKCGDWGGLWNYTWRDGLDEFGEPVHGSMYRYLWSNGPKECLEFADYTFDEHFGQPIPSFPPREVLFDYIKGRAKKNDVRRYIQFNRAVRWVTYDEKADKFAVTVEDLTMKETTTEEFDYVICSTGHFSIPNMPYFPGFEQFPGRILHSHNFRDAGEFEGKNLLVMGSSYSAEDISLQCKKYGAKSVTITYRTNPMGFKWPEGVDEVPLLQKVEGRTCTFKDGTRREIDAMILCTGYQHSFPFMESSLRLLTDNRLYPDNLYKGVFWQDNPKLMYLGMQDQYYTFTLFDAEAWLARDYIIGRFAMPSKSDRQVDIDAWRTREESLENPFHHIDFQADHIADIAKLTDYPDFDIDLTRKHFKEWEHDKEKSIIGYRDKAFVSACTGTQASAHHTEWWKAMDDSMKTFMSNPPGSKTAVKSA
ncbi:MAG: NAD(P)/FAD-dependent oxidoreductase [Halofilum sp. (in: g-proteobacteria)]